MTEPTAPSSRPSGPPTALDLLRASGRSAHDRVDHAFAGTDFGDRASYADFLSGHAAIVPGLEDRLRRVAAPLPPWTARAPFLVADLAALGLGLPAPRPPSGPDGAGGLGAERGWALGALYVLEGSRLGGRMLAARVGPDLPRAYLAAGHAQGGWRRFLDALAPMLGDAQGPFLAAAIMGARETFAAFEGAAPGKGRQPA